MTIWGKRLSEYVEFSKWFLGLIVAVAVLRLGLSLGGATNDAVRWISVTAVIWIGVFYHAIRVHTRGFGSYRHLAPIYVLQMLAAQVVIVPAIILGIVTGVDNVYTSPEFSFGGDGKTWAHAISHVLVAPTVGSLITWIVGSIVLLVARKASPGRRVAAA